MKTVLENENIDKDGKIEDDQEQNLKKESLVLKINDFKYLKNKEVDLSIEESKLSQVLRIAVYDEFSAYETYTAIINKLGEIHPFVNIKEAEANHYSMLIPLLEKYNVDIPNNDLALKIKIPNTYIECCEVGVSEEISNIRMYDHLLEHVEEEDVRDVFYKLQAASFNNHLPAFRTCVQEFYNSSSSSMFNPDDMMNKASEYQSLLEDIASGNMDQDKITKLLSKMNVSMITGAASGAALSAFLSSYLNKNKE